MNLVSPALLCPCSARTKQKLSSNMLPRPTVLASGEPARGGLAALARVSSLPIVGAEGLAAHLDVGVAALVDLHAAQLVDEPVPVAAARAGPGEPSTKGRLVQQVVAESPGRHGAPLPPPFREPLALLPAAFEN